MRLRSLASVTCSPKRRKHTQRIRRDNIQYTGNGNRKERGMQLCSTCPNHLSWPFSLRSTALWKLITASRVIYLPCREVQYQTFIWSLSVPVSLHLSPCLTRLHAHAAALSSKHNQQESNNSWQSLLLPLALAMTLPLFHYLN